MRTNVIVPIKELCVDLKVAVASGLRVRRKWKLKSYLLKIALFSWVLLIGCSKTTSNSSPIGPSPDTTIPLTVTTTTLPGAGYSTELSTSVPIDLADRVNYLGLVDITGTGGAPGNISLPLVGDVKVRLQTTNTRSQSIKGTLFLAFEDQLGLWGAQYNSSFPGTGFQITTTTGKNVDIIFADDDLVVRTLGVVVNNNFTGALYYRLRQAGDTACKQVTVTCNITYPNGYPYYYGSGGFECPPYALPDTVTPCRNYMNPADSHVKRLGNFRNTFSNISVLPEAP